MAAAAAAALTPSQVELDPKDALVVDLTDDDELDFATTPAADLVSHGMGGVVMALNLCPEAVQSGKRSKMIHKKGELNVDGLPLRLKWNVDYKGGAVVNFRVVTLKDPAAAAVASDGETPAAAASSSSSAGGAGAEGPVAGRKRARTADPANIDVKKHLALAVEGLKHKGKDAEAEQLQKLISEV